MERTLHTGKSASLPVEAHRLLPTLLLGVAVLTGLAPASRGATVQFATGVRTVGGYQENVSATFDISAHAITVHLLNLELNPTDVDQALGSVRFTVSGVTNPTPSSSTPTGISDTKLDISPLLGTPTDVAAETSTLWQTSAAGQQITLCAVCAPVDTRGLIIGGPSSTLLEMYSSADSTLTGGTSAEWIIGSGQSYLLPPLWGMDTSPDFTINFAASTNLTNIKISNVIFGFGDATGSSGDEEYGTEFLTVPQETPEPDSVILFGTGLGLIALAVGTRRLRRLRRS